MSNQSCIAALVEEYFAPLIGNPKMPISAQSPGGICGVLYGGDVYYFPYGRINENGEAPDKHTVFGLGSVTKTLTASILGQQDYSLLTGSINGYVPNVYELQTNEQNATFAQLATFTAGIKPSIPPKTGNRTNQKEFQDFINGMNPQNLPAPYFYSDSSIGFLAQILMGMQGYSAFDQPDTIDWLRKNLLKPLHMDHTGACTVSDTTHPLSDAFAYQDRSYIPIQYLLWVPWGAAGRVFSTCWDMMIFVQANVGITNINGNEVPESIANGMKIAQRKWASRKPGCGQGFAWAIFEFNPPIIGKDGSLPGVSSYVTVCREQKLGVVMLTNMQGVAIEAAAVGLTMELQRL
ncbi:MAG: beta-lactamase family protein [Phycisphaerales bacterium]|nr:beta-lactamase family protein [Phycisphaerales bacterium]